MKEAKQKDFTNEEFAVELVRRLNWLCRQSSDIKSDINRLIRNHVSCSQATAAHDAIMVVDGGDGGREFGVLGLLNGLAGKVDGGKRAVAAVYPDDQAAAEYDTLLMFDVANVKPPEVPE